MNTFHHRVLVLTIALIFTGFQMTYGQKDETCYKHCDNVDACTAAGCYFSFKQMHCFKDEYTSRVYIYHPNSVVNLHQCTNVGGQYTSSSMEITFVPDQEARSDSTIAYSQQGFYDVLWNDQVLYLQLRHAPVLEQTIPLYKGGRIFVKLFFGETLHSTPGRTMDITFNNEAYTIATNYDVFGEVGKFRPASIVFGPVERHGNVVTFNGKSSAYPWTGPLTVKLVGSNPTFDKNAMLSAICTFVQLPNYQLCGDKNACQTNPNGDTSYNDYTSHCETSKQVSNNDCADRIVGIKPDKACKACTGSIACGFGIYYKNCYSTQIYKDYDKSNTVSAANGNLEICGPLSVTVCTNYCFDPVACSGADGCIFDPRSMHCIPLEDNGNPPIADPSNVANYYSCLNIGGKAFVDSNGHMFQDDSGHTPGQIIQNHPYGQIQQAKAQDMDVYRSNKYGQNLEYPISALHDGDFYVKLFFTDMYHGGEGRHMKITFNDVHVIIEKLDVNKVTGYYTAHVEEFVFGRRGGDIIVNGETSKYPRIGHPILKLEATNVAFEKNSFLSGICIFGLSPHTNYCGKDKENECIARSDQFYDDVTEHCLSNMKVTDEDCAKLAQGSHDVELCISCASQPFCGFDPDTKTCEAFTSGKLSLISSINRNVHLCGEDCSLSNGYAEECRERGCGYCCRTSKCLRLGTPEFDNCNTGCQKNCFNLESCEAEGCLYQPDNTCIDCASYDFDAAKCREKKCLYCCDTNKCQSKNLDTCVGGCASSCFNQEECNSKACVYDNSTHQCAECSIFNGYKANCENSGCHFCCESMTCQGDVPTNCNVNDQCGPHCYEPDLCVNMNCLYNPTSNRCTSPESLNNNFHDCSNAGGAFCCMSNKCLLPQNSNSEVGPFGKHCNELCYNRYDCEYSKYMCAYDDLTNVCKAVGDLGGPTTEDYHYET